MRSRSMVAAITPTRVETADLLDEILMLMNEAGETPVLVGIDREGIRFLVYGWAPGGDGWAVNLCRDDPQSREFDIDEIERCEECHSEQRLPLSLLHFPVAVI